MIALYSCLKFAPGRVSTFPTCRLTEKAFGALLPGMKNVGSQSVLPDTVSMSCNARNRYWQLRTDKVGDLAAQFAGNCRRTSIAASNCKA